MEVSQNFVAFSEYTNFKKEAAIFVLFCLDASLGQSKKDSGRNFLSECIYVQIVKWVNLEIDSSFFILDLSSNFKSNDVN